MVPTEGGWRLVLFAGLREDAGFNCAPPQVPVLLMKVECHPRFQFRLLYDAVLLNIVLSSESEVVIKVRAPVLLLTAMFAAATGSALVISMAFRSTCRTCFLSQEEERVLVRLTCTRCKYLLVINNKKINYGLLSRRSTTW